MAVPDRYPRPLFTRQLQGGPERHTARDQPKSPRTTNLRCTQVPFRNQFSDDRVGVEGAATTPFHRRRPDPPGSRSKPCPMPSLNGSAADASPRKSQILPLNGIRRSLSASGRHPWEIGIGVGKDMSAAFFRSGARNRRTASLPAGAALGKFTSKCLPSSPTAIPIFPEVGRHAKTAQFPH